jgi:hypothetical protein
MGLSSIGMWAVGEGEKKRRAQFRHNEHDLGIVCNILTCVACHFASRPAITATWGDRFPSHRKIANRRVHLLTSAVFCKSCVDTCCCCVTPTGSEGQSSENRFNVPNWRRQFAAGLAGVKQTMLAECHLMVQDPFLFPLLLLPCWLHLPVLPTYKPNVSSHRINHAHRHKFDGLGRCAGIRLWHPGHVARLPTSGSTNTKTETSIQRRVAL